MIKNHKPVDASDKRIQKCEEEPVMTATPQDIVVDKEDGEVAKQLAEIAEKDTLR